MKANKRRKEILSKLLPIYLSFLLLSSIPFTIFVIQGNTDGLFFSIVSAIAASSIVIIYYFFFLPSYSTEDSDEFLMNTILPYIDLKYNRNILMCGYDAYLFTNDIDINNSIQNSSNVIFLFNCSEDDRPIFKKIFNNKNISRYTCNERKTHFILPDYSNVEYSSYRSERSIKYLDMKNEVIDYYMKNCNFTKDNSYVFYSDYFMSNDIILTDDYLIIRYNRISISRENKRKLTVVYDAKSDLYADIKRDIESFTSQAVKQDLSEL